MSNKSQTGFLFLAKAVVAFTLAHYGHPFWAVTAALVKWTVGDYEA